MRKVKERGQEVEEPDVREGWQLKVETGTRREGKGERNKEGRVREGRRRRSAVRGERCISHLNPLCSACRRAVG